jgi:hypothetical protein
MRIEKSLDRDVVVGDALSGRAGKQGSMPSCGAGAGAVEGESICKGRIGKTLEASLHRRLPAWLAGATEQSIMNGAQEIHLDV